MADHDLLQENPIVARLLSTAGYDVKTYRGYVGPVERDGYVSLYPTLFTLGLRFQIRESDIVHVERIPEPEGPFGAVMVWVRPGGDVTPHSARQDATFAADRLEMSGQEPVAVADDSCTSNCECVSNCDPCISICRWTCEPRHLAE